MRHFRNAIPIVGLVSLLLPATIAPSAQQPENPDKTRPKVEFGQGENKDRTPLDKAIEGKVTKRREKEKKDSKIHPKCAAALEILENPDASDSEMSQAEKDVAKFCSKTPGRFKEPTSSEDVEVDGKVRGRKIKTRTVLNYEYPGQRYGQQNRTEWDRFVLRPPQAGDLTPRQYKRQTNAGERSRRKSFLSDDLMAVNDDEDCIDSVTGEHLRGDDCFESNILRGTLTEAAGGCVHEQGIFLTGDPDDGIEDRCFDENGVLRTSLEELLDEDGPSPDQDGDGSDFDIDGDGYDGEDPRTPGDGEAVNDDRDCIDTVTGIHLGGLRPDLTTWPDGEPESCFDLAGKLKETLTALSEDEGGGCSHQIFRAGFEDSMEDNCYTADNEPRQGRIPTTGGCIQITYLEGTQDGTEDSCYNADNSLRITLAEMLDEDDGNPVDDDNDGLFDEDGAESDTDFQAACETFGRKAGLTNVDGLFTADGSCDLTRAVVAGANRKARKLGHDNVYNADDNGYTVATVAAQPGNPSYDYGTEPRQVVIEEVFTVICDEGTVLDSESGQCVAEEQAAALAAFYRGEVNTASTLMARQTPPPYTLMGFTFSPPRVRWGLFYKEEIDLWLFTITLFEAKIGYDFAIGAGFRLPMEVSFENLPESVLAEESFDFSTQIQPLDFTANDYTQFCLDHNMGDAAYCKRFAFPNALVPEQGDELALRLTAFAGLKVVIIEIPLINWAVDVDADLSEWCSLFLAYESDWEDLVIEMGRQGGDFGKAVTALGLNCGTYTTPFGIDRDDVPRQFPFIQNAPFVNKMIRADCAEAFVRGETIKLPDGEVYPLCTGLILGVSGASLGLGLGVDLEVGSDRIESDLSVSGDGVIDDPGAQSEIVYRHSKDEGEPAVVAGPVYVDNYDGAATSDHARLLMDDFTYCLNKFSIRLKGQVMFGGILTIFPDFDDFTLYRFTVPGIECGIPIGQHAGFPGVEVPVFVENYGLKVHVDADPDDPDGYMDLKMVAATPGEPALFKLAVENTGSMSGLFDRFAVEFSNERDQATNSLEFKIQGDNDGDGLINEDPPDKIDNDGDGLKDEDPVDQWLARVPALDTLTVGPLPAHTRGSSLPLEIVPFRHASTRPGVYAFRITGDSVEARDEGLAAVQPSPQGYRLQSEALRGMMETYVDAATNPHIAFMEIGEFYQPQMVMLPDTRGGLPGEVREYVVEGTNAGNVPDRFGLSLERPDFNAAACDLVSLGTREGCPYRAVPTQVPPGWVVQPSPPIMGTELRPLQPLQTCPSLGAANADDGWCPDPSRLGLQAPEDWAGMDDTTYQVRITGTSDLDPMEPAAKDEVIATYEVKATLGSRTRFIGLEIEAIIGELEAARDAGVATKGLLPIATHPVRLAHTRALARLEAGKNDRTVGALRTTLMTTRAFKRALTGSGGGGKLPPELFDRLQAQADAIIVDLERTIGEANP